MLIFGHLGIGSKIVSPWASQLPRRWLLLGTLLPDLIDKSVYYGMSLATGLKGAELGLISGTRTFGHTAGLMMAMSLVAWSRRSQMVAALALGAATHLALDGVFDALRGRDVAETLYPALWWPLASLQFPVLDTRGISEHLWSSMHPTIVGGEIAGALLLFWDFWKSSHRPEILKFVRARRELRPRSARKPRAPIT